MGLLVLSKGATLPMVGSMYLRLEAPPLAGCAHNSVHPPTKIIPIKISENIRFTIAMFIGLNLYEQLRNVIAFRC
jgi:hypothetical protein